MPAFAGKTTKGFLERRMLGFYPNILSIADEIREFRPADYLVDKGIGGAHPDHTMWKNEPKKLREIHNLTGAIRNILSIHPNI